MTRRTYAALFVGAVATFGLVSLSAYAGVLPTWVAPGNTDKVLHFTMAGVLASLLDRALGGRPAWRSRFAPPLAILLVLVPLGIEEYLQRLSPLRSSSFFDFAADTLGALAFTFAARLVARFARLRAA